jgi:biotin synthase
LSRITWPSFALSEVLPRLRDACASGAVRRICAQTVAGQGALDALASLLRAVRSCDGLSLVPVSASVYVRDPEELGRLFALGLDRAGVALDVASPARYGAIKGGSLAAARESLFAAAARFPGRISTHLIAGLGETEQELLELAADCLLAGIAVGLFAFTPVPGTALAAQPPPDLAAYRRLQAGLHLLRLGHRAGMSFDGAGRLVGLDVTPDGLRSLLADGRAFVTSGCADCNRPYYNERPGSVPYNYPRQLTAAELSAALALVLPLAEQVQQ